MEHRLLGVAGEQGVAAEHRPVREHRLGEPLHGLAKAEAVRALAEREGLDLSRCTAYSDSSNDVPMLTVVGHAVAVNPDGPLREQARQQGWEVRDFRTGRKAAKVGVPAARWKDVKDVVSASVDAGAGPTPCVVLRLRDGRSSTIPVDVLAADREAFVRDLRAHCQRAQGLRPLRPGQPGRRAGRLQDLARGDVRADPLRRLTDPATAQECA